MTATDVSQVILTVDDVLNFIAPYSGGSVPSIGTSEYNNRLRWIQVKQEEYARRGFWRRCLRKGTLTVTADAETTLLPVGFHKPNGLYIFSVDDVDWMEDDNEDEQVLSVEMDNDPASVNFTRWQVRYGTPLDATDTATIWYFANPPKPVAGSDKLLLPGDMIAYGVLSEFYRSINAEGSQDDARVEAENRMNAYLTQEVIPPKNELLHMATANRTTDRLDKARLQYSTRYDRYRV